MKRESDNYVGNQDRRVHKRHELACPIVLSDAAGRELLRARTLNVSDGGALVAAEALADLPPGAQAQMLLRIPRTTPNTHLFEKISAAVSVLRHQQRPSPALAVQFAQPLDLDLEV